MDVFSVANGTNNYLMASDLILRTCSPVITGKLPLLSHVQLVFGDTVTTMKNISIFKQMRVEFYLWAKKGVKKKLIVTLLAGKPQQTLCLFGVFRCITI